LALEVSAVYFHSTLLIETVSYHVFSARSQVHILRECIYMQDWASFGNLQLNGLGVYGVFHYTPAPFDPGSLGEAHVDIGSVCSTNGLLPNHT
jgi:hypothetical protein